MGYNSFYINYLLVPYKDIVLVNIIEFLKFGLIPALLVTFVRNFTKNLKYWYIFGTISFIIWLFYLDLVSVSKELSYMSFGVQLSYSFIIFAIYLYTKKGLMSKVINLFLITIILSLIFIYGNRTSALSCLIILLFLEINSYRKIHSFFIILKVTLISFFSIVTLFNIEHLLILLKNFVNKLGYTSYAVDKYILMTQKGVAESSSGRDYIYSQGLKIVEYNNLMPKDIGYYEFVTGSMYPHNIFIESLITFGIFIIPLMFLVIVLYLKIIFSRKDYYGMSTLNWTKIIRPVV